MKKVKLKKGNVATVYHAGSDSFYEATLIRPVSRQEMIAIGKASAGEDPRTDTKIFKDVINGVLKTSNTLVYNDLNRKAGTRRLKAVCWDVTNGEMFAMRRELERQFGSRVVEIGRTRTLGEPWVRLTAY